MNLFRGIGSLGAAGVATRVLQGGTHVVMGALLSPRQFGTYALAAGVAAVLQVLRDAGLRTHLIQGGTTGFPLRMHSVHGLSMVLGPVSGGLMLLLGVVLDTARFPGVMSTFAMFAVSMPILSLGVVQTAKVHVDLNFATVGRIELSAAAARSVVAIVAALLGAGAASLGAGFAAGALTETLLYRRATDVRGRLDRVDGRGILATLRRTKWLILGSVGASLGKQGDYVLVAPLITTEQLGIYYFGYQLVNTLVQVVGGPIERVLMGRFVESRDGGEAEGTDHGLVERMALWMVWGMVPVAVAAVLAFRVANAVVWQSAWTSAFAVMLVLGLLLPVHAATVPTTAALRSSGRYRYWALSNTWRSGLVPVAAAVAVLFTRDVIDATLAIAAGVGVYRAATSTFYAARVGARMSRTPRLVWLKLFVPVAVALIALVPLETLSRLDVTRAGVGAFIADAGLFLFVYLLGAGAVAYFSRSDNRGPRAP